MVSFTCDVCQDVVKKSKLDNHCKGPCRNAWYFTCVDCNTVFEGFAYSTHTSCITEAEKYKHKAGHRPEKPPAAPSAAAEDPRLKEQNVKLSQQNGAPAEEVAGDSCSKKPAEASSSSDEAGESTKEAGVPAVRRSPKYWKKLIDQTLSAQGGELEWKALIKVVAKAADSGGDAEGRKRRLSALSLESIRNIPQDYLSEDSPVVRLTKKKKISC